MYAVASLALSPFFLSALSSCESTGASPEQEAAQARLEEQARAIEAEVSELRGRAFLRPVDVQLADEEDFREYVDRRFAIAYGPGEFEAEEYMAKMLGLVPTDMDLWETTLELLDAQVGGYYDPSQDKFYLMEQFDKPQLTGVILAHELTHALDDQLYRMDETVESLGGNGDAELAYHSVIEGSGTALMTQWQMKKMLAGELSMTDMEGVDLGMEAMKDLPEFLWKPLLASYVRGQMFLNRTTNMMAAQMKAPKLADIERAFKTPPSSTEQILHPKKYWDEDEFDAPQAVEVDPASLPEGWELLNENTLGELFLGMVVNPLDERDTIDPENAMSVVTIQYTNDAASGWDGDRYVLLGRGDERVLLAHTVWDDESEAVEFQEALAAMGDHIQAALGELAEAGPGDHRWEVVRFGNQVAITAAVVQSDSEPIEGVVFRVVESAE